METVDVVARYEMEEVMQAISRRQVLLTGGASALFSGQRVSAQAATSTSNVSEPHNRPYSMPLGQYVIEQMADLHAKTSSGKVTSNDLMHASSVVRLYAHHLEAWGIDDLAKNIAGNLNAGNTNLITNGIAAKLFENFARHNPTLNHDNFIQSPTFQVLPEHLADVQASIISHGVSWHYHAAADFLREASREETGIQANVVARPSADANMKPALYMRSQHPHLVEVQLAACKKAATKAICNKLKSSYWNDVIQGAMTSMITALGVSGAYAACMAVGGGSLAVEIVTMSEEFIPVTVVQVTLCQIITAAATPISILGVGPGVGEAVRNYQSANCG